MNKFIIIFLVIGLCGCACPVDVGDTVVDISTKKIGTVKAIDKYGSGTKNCQCAVLHQDGTWSKKNITDQNLVYTSKRRLNENYVPNWKYEKL